jgi:hypothetical protein
MVVPFAFALWFASVLAIAILWFWTDQTFLGRYQSRYGGYPSRKDQTDSLVRDPVGLLRQLPRQVARQLDARQIPVDDPSLEGLRTRASRLYLLLIAAGFGGLPLSFVLVGIAGRVAQAVDLPFVVYIAITAGWGIAALWVIRRPDRSRIAVAIVLTALCASLLVTVVGVVMRF